MRREKFPARGDDRSAPEKHTFFPRPSSKLTCGALLLLQGETPGFTAYTASVYSVT